MKVKILSFFAIFLTLSMLVGCSSVRKSSVSGEKTYHVLIKTDYGDMLVKLYNETPQHRDNFLKLVGKGFYDDLLFHRVINGFMIQGGDPDSKEAKPGQMLGEGSLGYSVPAEFRDSIFHKKGVLAAARLGDDENPERASSSCQFYLVQGRVWDTITLQKMAARYNLKLTPEQMKVYSTIGGTPHLDGAYTVFGEVVDGLDVIDKIAAVPTDRMDRPLTDVKMKMTIIDVITVTH